MRLVSTFHSVSPGGPALGRGRKACDPGGVKRSAFAGFGRALLGAVRLLGEQAGVQEAEVAVVAEDDVVDDLDPEQRAGLSQALGQADVLRARRWLAAR